MRIFKRRPYLGLLLLTVFAVFVHGYHPAVEDGEIYLPGIKKLLDPRLYPFGDEFFQNHANATLFGRLISESIRVTHLPFDAALFICYVASLFLTLLACWKCIADCFAEAEARWAGVMLTACLLTLPVAGTSLYIADPYLTPRSIVLFAILFAARNAWHERYIRFAGWSVFAAVIHPLMAAFGLLFAVLLLASKRFSEKTSALTRVEVPFAVMATLPFLPVASPAYRAAVHTRSYFFILQWQWYEWLGIFAPLLLLWWFSRIAQQKEMLLLKRISQALIAFAVICFAAALLLTIPAPLQTLARLQPMRSLHLVYTFLMLLGGGLIGKVILRNRAWRWFVFFTPICTGMWVAQLNLFPESPHIEWPGAIPSNDWLQAFRWIRTNTPVNAVFAVDPKYMLKDDQHGFRAMAERSRLADAIKDSGAVTMFPNPPMAEDWLEQTTDQKGWDSFQLADFRHLESKYGVHWLTLERRDVDGLVCPYANKTVMVCRIDSME